MSQLVRWGFDRAAGAKARPRPLVRATAYRGAWPIVSHRTLAEVIADEAAVRGVSTSLDTNGVMGLDAKGKKEARPRIKSGVTKKEDCQQSPVTDRAASIAGPVGSIGCDHQLPCEAEA